MDVGKRISKQLKPLLGKFELLQEEACNVSSGSSDRLDVPQRERIIIDRNHHSRQSIAGRKCRFHGALVRRDEDIDLAADKFANRACNAPCVGVRVHKLHRECLTITGDIMAKEIVVRGKVKGTIRATRVLLMEGADVAGDIFYDRMSMEEGAHFVGASNAEPLPASPPDERIS